MSKHRPTLRTTCDISDILSEIVTFVQNEPDWMHNPDSVRRMAMAYQILTTISGPDMVTDEEYEFVIDIHRTLQETP
jgi:hypothetical protein